MELSITVVIIIITVLISFGAFNNKKIQNDLIFYPPAILEQKQWYRFFTCGFIHADATHLFFNMFSLFAFGPAVEAGFEQYFEESGRWLFLLMYATALFISLLPTYLKHKYDEDYRSLGASGAVSAVIFAGLMLTPLTAISILFIPIPIPGFVFGPLYLLFTAYMERRGGDNINHSAHLWGALYGLAFIIIAAYTAGHNIIGIFLASVKQYLGL
ncbi:MAG TPA: rhomboid family intramembrane serine protease [Flavisolibacter sp.]|nr:rhomboid family intramembrane serine protease [Flavisolibacter sp.]